ncbi:MAG: flagellar basal body P-ring protein FlgI [Pirellulales bacterium]
MKLCRGLFLCGLMALSGCAAPALRSQSPEDMAGLVESSTRLIGEVARPFGHTYVKVESVALVTGLDGTGSDPAPSHQRAALLHELQTIGVQNPNHLLALPSTSLVLVRGFLPPGVQKGDRFDLDVQVPTRSETTSLRNGWLMETRLTELTVLEGQIREGHTWALGEGALLVDPSAEGEKDRALLTRARVLGGGSALKSRDLGLFIVPEAKSVRTASLIGQSINRRFHTFSRGIKTGVANPRTDERVDLKIHPRYKDNLARYIRVVRSLALQETTDEQTRRLELLERQLLDPITSLTAALRLEAIGAPAVPTLTKGIEAGDPEVRFYAAEALAYLDESAAAAPLARAAREEPAFRAYALAALSTIDDMSAHEELVKLLEVSSSETRYGAFRALWAMNSSDPLIRGENLGGQFSYHVLNTAGPPMIHVTRSYRPELVLFSHDQQLKAPFVLEAGKSILVKGAGDKVTVSKFAVNQTDQKRVVSTQVDDIIRAIVELGGTYPDVVQALQQAKNSAVLDCRFEVDALPDGSREYRHRDEGSLADEQPNTVQSIEVASPLPELFFSKRRKTAR